MSTPRRRWTPETIQETLEPIVAELGRFPKPKELAERGLSGLSAAMGRNGGVAEWKARFDAPAEPVVTEPPAAVTHEAIAERAYYIALERQGGDPFEHWLAAERELVAA
jgi:hypothetical protein